MNEILRHLGPQVVGGNYPVTGGGRRCLKMRAVPDARSKDDAARVLVQVEGQVASGKRGFEEVVDRLCGAVMDEWIQGISNRNADDDRSRYRRHVRPHFANLTLERAQHLAVVMTWLDRLQKDHDISSQTARHAMVLSRFWSWAAERGLAKVNPVKRVQPGLKLDPDRRLRVAELEATLVARSGPAGGLAELSDLFLDARGQDHRLHTRRAVALADHYEAGPADQALALCRSGSTAPCSDTERTRLELLHGTLERVRDLDMRANPNVAASPS